MNVTMNKAGTKIVTSPAPASLEEWREWGKQAYKGQANTMRRNLRHPDYDTHEKREALHNANEAGTGDVCYNWTDEGRAELRARWGYTDAMIEDARTAWIAGYKASRKWYVREDAKHQAVLDSFAPIFTEAARIAAAVDVSDIVDGFPCGSAHVYLDYAERDTQLGKALAHFKSSTSTPQFKYEIPIKMPRYGQCIAYDERVCAKVCEFLRNSGVMADVYSWID